MCLVWVRNHVNLNMCDFTPVKGVHSIKKVKKRKRENLKLLKDKKHFDYK
jgi:hypothetical protein